MAADLLATYHSWAGLGAIPELGNPLKQLLALGDDAVVLLQGRGSRGIDILRLHDLQLEQGGGLDDLAHPRRVVHPGKLDQDLVLGSGAVVLDDRLGDPQLVHPVANPLDRFLHGAFPDLVLHLRPQAQQEGIGSACPIAALPTRITLVDQGSSVDQAVRIDLQNLNMGGVSAADLAERRSPARERSA